MLLGFPFGEEGVSRVILVVLDTWPGILPSASSDLLLAMRHGLFQGLLLLVRGDCVRAGTANVSLRGCHRVTTTTRFSVLSSASVVWFSGVMR